MKAPSFQMLVPVRNKIKTWGYSIVNVDIRVWMYECMDIHTGLRLFQPLEDNLKIVTLLQVHNFHQP